MGAGPSRVHEDVLKAMSQTTIGHLDPAMVAMMDELKDMLRYVFQTKNAMTFPVSGPGSLGMEACVNNVVERGDKVIVAINGVFGTRMAEVTRRAGAEVIVTEDEWGTAVDPNKVEEALKANPGVKAVGFVHAETSTGAMSDAAALCRLATDHDALSIVDTVTSLGGVPVNIDVWGADAVYSGTQKCLSCPPGLSPVTFSDKAVQVTLDRETPVQSWLLDLSLVASYWQGDAKSGARTYHHTAPVNALMGLHEALRRIVAEGLESVWARHKAASQIIVDGLEEMGFSILVDEAIRLPELLTVNLPDGIDDGAVRGKLLNDYGIEISAGLGPFAGKLWRIGVMGEGARPENAERVLSAIKESIA
ncbi:MAG: alanine--glyoxylate aminotransferase family protein [Rhodospirillaceae bacterium]|nr:alanine--glyoxylate aminotransferase family protein [Rhodospirillaceae bacterium]MBT5939375.1 alanine--glyoxylate aminotransferase family protein [Rhodospirillaceae bacterium]MBT7266340.1 alanine--glyoxylate aminotransferase family protein [Rhodospirillaceae bacterium]